ncbi:hypothetical protein [Rhizobium mongolense]|uniref:hypothetical protein n=1 Tax=Rhizobium mongolense TaxID=57676 RepID=UPI0034A422A7
MPKFCPAQTGSRLEKVLRNISIATFRACQCRDYARVDLRIDHAGRPFVLLEINAMPGLSMRSSYVLADTAAGYGFAKLVNRILDVAQKRYPGINTA